MRRGIEVVSMDQIVAEWDAASVFLKILNGQRQLIVVDSSPAVNPRYVGGMSRIIKVLTHNNEHIGTYHEILMPDGEVPHRHPKDYTRRDCSRVRVPSEPQEQD